MNKIVSVQIQLPCFLLNISLKFRDILNSIFALQTDLQRSQLEIVGQKGISVTWSMKVTLVQNKWTNTVFAKELSLKKCWGHYTVRAADINKFNWQS